MSTSSKTSITAMGQPQKVIDLRITQAQLISILVTLATVGVTMWYKGERSAEELVRLQSEIKEMRSDMKSGSSAMAALTSTVSLLTFRVENTETELRIIKQMDAKKAAK